MVVLRLILILFTTLMLMSCYGGGPSRAVDSADGPSQHTPSGKDGDDGNNAGTITGLDPSDIAPQYKNPDPERESYVDRWTLPVDSEQVRSELGPPTHIEDAGPNGEYWAYDYLGVDIGIIEGMVFQVWDTHGHIREGLTVGDPASKVTALGLPTENDVGLGWVAVIDRGDADLFIVTSEEKVSGFVIRLKPDTD